MKDNMKVIGVRNYGIVMPNGIVGKLTFAMCDPRDEDSVPARFARQQGAEAYGLITVEGGGGCTPDSNRLDHDRVSDRRDRWA